MLKPKMVQLPDYSGYIGKEFIITEDYLAVKPNSFDRPMLKGARFIIKEIKNTQAVVKVTNSKQELEKLGMLDYDFSRIINNTKKEIKILKKVYKMWEDEPDKFIIDEESFWNKDDGDGRGHCINTSYHGIPFDHPDKFGMAKAHFHKGKYTSDDSIMTLDFKRTDGKTNVYSYQSGKNEFYSKNCYGFMLKGKEVFLERWESRIDLYKKWVFDWIFRKTEVSIKSLNKMNFKLYN